MYFEFIFLNVNLDVSSLSLYTSLQNVILLTGGMQGLQNMMRQFQGAGGMPGGGGGHN